MINEQIFKILEIIIIVIAGLSALIYVLWFFTKSVKQNKCADCVFNEFKNQENLSLKNFLKNLELKNEKIKKYKKF